MKKTQVKSFKKEGQKVLQRQGDLGEVWISGYHFAQNIEELKRCNIRAVCSAVSTSFRYPEDIRHKIFNLNDNNEENVQFVFKPAFEFIEKERKKGNVLVHCAAGISRSSMLLCSYLMKKYHRSLAWSLSRVKNARPCCQPNTGFMKQLKTYEKRVIVK